MTYAAMPGKPGYEEDAALVTAQLIHFPQSIGDSIVATGIGLVACRGNVTDFAPQLHNQAPRNWPPSIAVQTPTPAAPAHRSAGTATMRAPRPRRPPVSFATSQAG